MAVVLTLNLILLYAKFVLSECGMMCRTNWFLWEKKKCSCISCWFLAEQFCVKNSQHVVILLVPPNPLMLGSGSGSFYNKKNMIKNEISWDIWWEIVSSPAIVLQRNPPALSFKTQAAQTVLQSRDGPVMPRLAFLLGFMGVGVSGYSSRQLTLHCKPASRLFR